MPDVPDWSNEPASDDLMDPDALEHARAAAEDEPKFGDDVDLSDAGERPPEP